MTDLTVDVADLAGAADAAGACSVPLAWPRLAGHLPQWAPAIAAGLRHRGFLLRVRKESQLRGAMPLILVKGPLFGRFLVSLPYINTGGAWARDEETAQALVDRACDLADELDVRYLELRHEVPVDHPKLHFQRTEKVHLRLPLPASDALLDKSFKSKLRSQVRKAGQFDHTVVFGGAELLKDFYDVFAVNMRDLGTPVFSRRLFAEVLRQSDPQRAGFHAELCVLRNQGRAIAAALLVHAEGMTEVPSASCLRSHNHTGANMWMYRHLLRRAIERGSQQFDFGRSSVGSGTYKFKTQWGAVPHPAVWQYYVRKGSVEAMRPDNAGNQRLIKIWQKLPVWLTRIIGPEIVRGIP